MDERVAKALQILIAVGTVQRDAEEALEKAKSAAELARVVKEHILAYLEQFDPDVLLAVNKELKKGLEELGLRID